MRTHAILMDLSRAWEILPAGQKRSVLLCGFLGLTFETGGRLLSNSKQSVNESFHDGLDNMVAYLNGGYSE